MPEPIIHGDIYIDNVLVSGSESALLNDFGLSSIVSSDTTELQHDAGLKYMLGRPAYEAPERHSDVSAPRSFKTDVFAFGMLMFHAYSGRSPFASLGHPGAIVVAIYEGRRPERSEITRDDFPDALWELVQECWRHDPQERPSMFEVYLRLRVMRGRRLITM